jgi:hypothetical protein
MIIIIKIIMIIIMIIIMRMIKIIMPIRDSSLRLYSDNANTIKNHANTSRSTLENVYTKIYTHRVT